MAALARPLRHDLEPLWKALQESHAALTPSLGGLEPRLADDSWAAARESYAKWLRDPDAFLIIAEQAGRPVGFALVTMGEPYWGWASGERVADVDTLSVLAEARGQNTGTKLMDAVEVELERRGVREFRITVLAANVDAMRFYERRGLVPVTQTLLGRVPTRSGRWLRPTTAARSCFTAATYRLELLEEAHVPDLTAGAQNNELCAGCRRG